MRRVRGIVVNANAAAHSLKNAAPSPKYQDETYRLGRPGRVVNAWPGAGIAVLASTGVAPMTTPACTSISHFPESLVLDWAQPEADEQARQTTSNKTTLGRIT